ncbi:MAG: penicillin-binding protein 1C [Syntrophus sp. (in: bacteria)]|nr:penicillin-binding protein 1C [Syntrophus sp. (in: bacteria)]
MSLRVGVEKRHFPDFDVVRTNYRVSDLFLLDRHGDVIDGLRVDMFGRRLEWVSLRDISPAMIRATLHVEDRRFYKHNGVDWYAVVNATFHNIRPQRLRGASTITMQLVSILDENLKSRAGGRRGITQKWEQVKAAIALEQRWSKAEILEAYLNLISFRGELQGICTASRGLFDKEPGGLNDVESYILASLITSPNASVKAVVKRACYFSRSAGVSLSCEDIQATADIYLARPYRIKPFNAIAPHVARMLLKDSTGHVVSTIDGKLQRFAYETLNQYVQVLKEQHVYDGAVMVVDNKTGEILAYVGNSGTSPDTVFVDGIKAARQAGSTLKPFLYELAIEKQFITAASLIDDTPLHVTTSTGLYVPQNYDKIFRGFVTVRTALSASINVPAVRTLLLVGIAPFVERLKKLGFVSLTRDAEFYGYSLALGSADVTLYELVNAYRVFANNGNWSETKLISGKKDNKTKKIMDKKAAFIISHILSDREARSTTFGLENPLATRFWTAAKTGTSKDMRDNWCIGYSDKYTVGVWVGNFSGEPMRNVTGITGAAPVWLEIMNYLHVEKTSRAPQAPPDVVSAKVIYQQNIEPSREEWFIRGTESIVTVKRNTLHAKPRITYPADETLISIDPEIPDDLQRVPFQYQPETKKYGWVLNDEKIGISEHLFFWKPKRGKFKLSIMDADSHILDSVEFAVK